MERQRTLGEIVSIALARDDLHAKVASRETTEAVEAEDFLAELDLLAPKLATKDDDEDDEVEEKSEKTVKKATLDDASYGLKLAQALESAAAVVTKLAQAEAPAVTESQFADAKTQSPKAQTPGGTAIAMQNGAKPGATGALPTDLHETPKAAEKIATDRAATERLLRTKVAEYEMYVSLGHTAAAEEAKKVAEKIAAELDTSAGLGSHVPDNAGMATMTKAQARDANTREASALLGIPAKKDNAVEAHVGRSDGQKLSSLSAVLGKGSRALQAVGGKALDSAARGAKGVAGAAENRLFNGAPVAGLKSKALEGAVVHGHNTGEALTRLSGSEAARKAVGAGVVGAGVAGAASLGGKKEAATEDADGGGKFTDTKERRMAEAHGATRGRSIGNVLGAAAGGAVNAAAGNRLHKTMPGHSIHAGKAALTTGLAALAGGAVTKRLTQHLHKNSPNDDADIKRWGENNAKHVNKGLAKAKPYSKED